ncbi:rod shape-determining protein MreC [Costertonia aggregata]|uniref:Cell shape-determining protein MreC n=1 Tax=Costertonia aggregata TaxID=343403 RepID=A0A7H9AQX9_9FLAO|nr:rod shape-determining protein MreC [Costertonia aggregata]QLG45809.1 rod shape-determining protein MreC [Costertonia aggregata]
MQQIINFILRYKTSLLYFLLMTIALAFTINSHSYHQSKFFNSANWFTGNIYSTSKGITDYFNLKEENRILLEENKRLRNIVFNQKTLDSIALDTANINYTVTAAHVVKNSFSNPRNYVTIDVGKRNNIEQDMGVITTKGILGIVENTSNKFSSVQSILNENSNINAKVKGTNHFGSLVWDGDDYTTVQLIDIPRLAKLTVGDTIVTGAMSSIFPENVPIGIIKKFDLNVSKSFYSIDVQLFNDMTNIKNVYVIGNLNKAEVKQLEAETENDQ